MHKIFYNNTAFSNSELLFDSINQFFKPFNIFFNNNYKFVLLKGNSKFTFNTAKFNNPVYKNYYYSVFKISANSFLFSYYDNEFIIYVNIKNNYFFGIITQPERFHYDFFREFLIMPITALRLFFEKIYFFHSSIFSINDKGILISGNSGHGKSTLTLLLLQSFNNKIFLSDDKAFLKINNDELFGGGFKSYLKVKNPKLPQLKKFLQNLEPALKIHQSNFYSFNNYTPKIKLHYLLFPVVKKDSFSSIKKLDKKEFYFHLINNSYDMILNIDKENYLDFLEIIVAKTEGYSVVLGKDMENIPFLSPFNNL